MPPFVPFPLSQVLTQPELSGLCELDLGSNSLSAGSLLKIRELLMVGRGGGSNALCWETLPIIPCWQPSPA